MQFATFLIVTGLLFSSCSSALPKPESPERAASKTSWIERSNAVAREYALGDADRFPEAASSLGYREFDAKAMQLEDDMETKDLAYLNKWRERLKLLLEEPVEDELRTDYEVLLSKVEEQIEGKRLEQELNEIAYCPGSKIVFQSIQSLVNPQSPAETKRAAVDRFKAYVGGHGTFKPFLEACVSRSRYTISKRTRNPFYPLKAEIEEYLSQSKDFVAGTEELLKASGREDWKTDFEKYEKQVAAHDRFMKSTILKKARVNPRLPKPYYAHILKVRGISESPEGLVAMAEKDYKDTYKKFVSVAAEVAKRHQLKDPHPASVIAFLKKDQVGKPEEVRALYEDADRRLTEIIRKHALVSLPEAPLRIRLAGDAESKAVPVPHLKPPPLVDNRGERPEFVVPTSTTGALPFDDFSFKAAAIVLTAHEGRPGHDLQFSSMLDNGVSVIRARYARNNVNIEGWGLYAEEVVYPYLPPESQLVALQTRLWRIARAYLDPRTQLGTVTPAAIVKVFTRELGVSKPMALLEVRRYTYDDVGQAPSYYYGLKKLLEAKEATKAAVGAQFSEKCFNDAVLGLGLLPVEVIAQRLKSLKCDSASVAK